MSKLTELGMNAANNVVGQVLGLVAGGAQDRRQVEQQKKLSEVQGRENRKMADYNQNLALDMWDKTNYAAQVEQMKKAGVNVGLMYGGAGSGGSTSGAGQASGVSGASAGDPNAGTAMGMQMASQLALMNAQKENIEADTANKKASAGGTTASTEGTEFQNAVNKMIGVQQVADRYQSESDSLKIKSEKDNAEWEQLKAVGYENNFTDENTPAAKAMKAGFQRTVTELENAKTSGNIAKAEQVIREYEAGLAKEGIDPRSPWYVKILGDLLAKVGLSPIAGVKGVLK